MGGIKTISISFIKKLCVFLAWIIIIQVFLAQNSKIGIFMKLSINSEIKAEFIRLRKQFPTAPINLLIGISLENIADNYIRNKRYSSEYKNIKKF